MLQYRLAIQSQKPLLSIRSQPARLSIRHERAMFEQKGAPVRMEISHTPPSFTVDRSKSSWAVNQVPVLQLARQFQEQSAARGLDAIGRIAGEGNRLQRIYDPGATVARIVSDRLQQQASLNIVPVPRPRIQWEPGELTIDWTPYSPSLAWPETGGVRIETEPHTTEVSLARRGDIQIRFEPVRPAEAGTNPHSMPQTQSKFNLMA